MPCSPPSHEGRCDGPHPCPWSRLAAGAGHQTWRCATAPRLVPAPVPAASPLDPLRLCCPLWAWSMWDGVGNLQADAVALRALSWGLLSWHWHLSLPSLLCSPLRRLCRPTMPHIVNVAFFVHCRHFSPIICRRAKRGMRTSNCFVWCFEISATPVLPPCPRPFGTIHQTKERFSMVKCPTRGGLPTTFNWKETAALSGKSHSLQSQVKSFCINGRGAGWSYHTLSPSQHLCTCPCLRFRKARQLTRLIRTIMSQINRPTTRTPPIHPTSHIGHMVPPMPPIIPPIIPRPMVSSPPNKIATTATPSNTISVDLDIAFTPDPSVYAFGASSRTRGRIAEHFRP